MWVGMPVKQESLDKGGERWTEPATYIGNDEINVIDAGANYGWPVIEGSRAMPGMRTPIVPFTPAVAPSGASFYRGQRFPRFVNNLFVATKADDIRQAKRDRRAEHGSAAGDEEDEADEFESSEDVIDAILALDEGDEEISAFARKQFEKRGIARSWQPIAPSRPFSFCSNRLCASRLTYVFERWIEPCRSTVTRFSGSGRSSDVSQKSSACRAM